MRQKTTCIRQDVPCTRQKKNVCGVQNAVRMGSPRSRMRQKVADTTSSSRLIRVRWGIKAESVYFMPDPAKNTKHFAVSGILLPNATSSAAMFTIPLSCVVECLLLCCGVSAVVLCCVVLCCACVFSCLVVCCLVRHCLWRVLPWLCIV